MTCRDVTFGLPDFVGGKLLESEKAQIISHLESCHECRLEVEQLQMVFSLLREQQPVHPPEQYWVSLVPRIHERIGKKPGSAYPEWLPRFILPAAAAIVLAAVLIDFSPKANFNDLQDLSAFLIQMPSDELQLVNEQQRYTGILEPANLLSELPATPADDKEALAELLQGDDGLGAVQNMDPESTVRALSSQDVDEFVTILQQKLSSN